MAASNSLPRGRLLRAHGRHRARSRGFSNSEVRSADAYGRLPRLPLAIASLLMIGLPRRASAADTGSLRRSMHEHRCPSAPVATVNCVAVPQQRGEQGYAFTFSVAAAVIAARR